MDTALLQQFLLCHISYTVLAPFFPFPSNKHRMPFHSHCNCSHQYDLASNLHCILVSIARIFFFPFETHSWGCGKSRNSGADFVSLRGLCPAKIQCQQLRPALTFWKGREHLELWVFPGNGGWVMQSHTEINISVCVSWGRAGELHWAPPERAGSRNPIPNLAFSLAIPGCSSLSS